MPAPIVKIWCPDGVQLSQRRKGQQLNSRITINSRSDIDALEPRKSRYRAWDAQVPGLCVRVAPSGSRVWYYEYRDPSGARQAVKLGSADRMNPGDARREARKLGLDPAAAKREAKAKRAETQAAKEAAKKRTVSHFLAHGYAEHLKTTRSGDATAARIRSAWAGLLERDMATLVPLDIERERRKALGRGLSPQTVNRDWNALRALLNAARKAGLISSVPEVAAIKGADNKRVRWLGQLDRVDNMEQGERERFLTAVEDMGSLAWSARVAITTSYWTGLRRGEVFTLEWRDIDLERAQLTVRAENAKSGKSRHVPLHETIVGFLANLDRTSPLVVPSQATGKPLTQIKRSWATLCKRAELTDFRFHDLRHDFASRLVMAGTDLYVVRDLLGHSTIQLTERYAHLAPEHHKAAVEALG
ncbi:hypothetical protein CSC82_11595 [Rhodobacteraceae bacterium 4F10]|nr:hypothetical protein CSC82_11595 [Rhodobacteraceae bacterium 4F10]